MTRTDALAGGRKEVTVAAMDNTVQWMTLQEPSYAMSCASKPDDLCPASPPHPIRRASSGGPTRIPSRGRCLCGAISSKHSTRGERSGVGAVSEEPARALPTGGATCGPV